MTWMLVLRYMLAQQALIEQSSFWQYSCYVVQDCILDSM